MVLSHTPETTTGEIWPILTRLKQHTGEIWPILTCLKHHTGGNVARSHTTENITQVEIWPDLIRLKQHTGGYGLFSHA